MRGHQNIHRDLLGEAILQYIQSAPQSGQQINDYIGASRRTTYSLIRELQEAGRIHQVRKGIHRGWLAGPAPKWAKDEGTAATLPNRTTVRVFPSINRCDPLVAFLFGRVA